MARKSNRITSSIPISIMCQRQYQTYFSRVPEHLLQEVIQELENERRDNIRKSQGLGPSDRIKRPVMARKSNRITSSIPISIMCQRQYQTYFLGMEEVIRFDFLAMTGRFILISFYSLFHAFMVCSFLFE
jgi:hypothetical protein